MLERPWLLQFGPVIIPTDARDELNAVATGMSAKDYVNGVWKLRNSAYPKRIRARSKTWPPTIRVEGGGYRLRTELRVVSN